MDLKEFLEDHDIEYWTKGKNVTRGWYGIQCPFCEDSSNHLGIRLRDLRAHCWKCGPKNFIRVIKELAHVSYREAKDLSKQIEAEEIPLQPESETEILKKLSKYENYVKLPKEATRHFPKLHKDYLKKRGFPPLQTIRKYKLKAVYNYGKFSFRIIIPIFKDGQMMTFTSRDVTGYGEPKYLHAGPKESFARAKDFIYGADNIPKGGDAVLVEGILDAWRLGKGAISSLGTQISGAQMVQLSGMEINRLFIFFDNDRPGIIAAKRNAKIIAPLVKELEIIRMKADVKDPGSLTKENAALIMKGLRLNV